jgi:hypothetical protein
MNKQTNTHTKKSPGSGTIEFLSLVLLLQHPVLVLVFKQRLCLSLARWLGSLASFFFFSLSFSGSCLVSSSLSEVWQFKFACCPQVLEMSSVAHQPSCFGVGFPLCWFTGGLFLCLAPFLWGKVSDPSASPCCQCVMMVCWLFFNFAVLFDFGCCSLAR